MPQGSMRLIRSRAQTSGLNELRAPGLAWPTILLGTMNLMVYLGVLVLVVRGAIALWVGALVNVVLVYLSYTPVHEAVHSNIADRKRDWVNVVIGMCGAVALLHNFHLHRVTHLAHHAHLNDPEKDADHWVAGKTRLSVFFRCATLIFSHYVVGVRRARASAGGNRKLAYGLLENVLTLVPLVIFIANSSWPTGLLVIVAPALIGQTILGYLFDYLVHAPFNTNDTVAGTRAFVAKGRKNQLLTFAYLAQNYHVVHHLRTSVPFYQYSKAFAVVEPELIAHGAPIVRLGF
jgi:beta-carotene hydroxylase